MKTYTFKIKLHYPNDKHPVVLSVIHCPLEVVFDSLKEVKQFEQLYNSLREVNKKEVPFMYVTASDYLVNNSEDYVYNDYILCEYKAIIESKSLTELFTHDDFYGFVEDLLTTKTEKELISDFIKIPEFIKEHEEDEV